ncbi:1,4-dihydroxy-2-naphthoate prenyltransferase [Halobacillus karajensis]|uniref:1,4-dihydroxy-2-naphthoate octaprenyltransferase n=1 Tax=Halobacillus karajensis TaxID=195088 RepID=A0A024P9Y1_9BACI|nr:1,4-dihydroxy-2-naphthoate polyprenyltransferase [Halobacillus karajensis]CDQ21377.1 1,4-dihydroxy-2-naphthoate octaprenyltransferase [Halobacillus karajensis]CDQ25551.1 1,4-dihydroxy-2-naphthoate octaprenyltransferase [Halobacillus karajensis]CDQ25822.1 1,4-dihydroxy-2-naphthoate octaprenyltransferase [Halobacillus karajensis]SEI13749.1 1,4-dihydroxy-2-naphthoate prenyltransferase [Halobacillus karajensis]
MSTAQNQNVKTSLNEREGFQVWWRLLRPHTLTAAFVPVFVGTMLAALEKSINFWLFAAMLLASILIQAATNMFNEYYDYKRGLDNENSVGIGGTIVRDGIHPKTVLSLAFIFFILAGLLGVYICASSSWWIAAIGLISMLFGYLYTGGPLPIAYTPFGEVTAGFFMGTIIIGISYFIQTLTMTAEVAVVSVPVAIFVGSILLANNIRDRAGDAENGRKTLAILFGHKGSVIFISTLFVIAFLWTVGLILLGTLPVWAFITLFSVIKGWKAIQGFIGKTQPLEMMPAMKATAQTNTIYGLLLGLSLLLHLYFPLV